MSARFALFVLLLFVALSAFKCRKEKALSTCYKARLEIKGMCMNYTIKVLSPIDASLVEATWTDPNTNTPYQNVFGLGNACNFPADINEGDEFYFQINNNAPNNCAVCLAYYPTPQKKLSIVASKSPCN
jgi:hypothetical protein